MQVKYEMLRRVRTEGQSVAKVTALFGVSRLTFYKCKAISIAAVWWGCYRLTAGRADLTRSPLKWRASSRKQLPAARIWTSSALRSASPSAWPRGASAHREVSLGAFKKRAR